MGLGTGTCCCGSPLDCTICGLGCNPNLQFVKLQITTGPYAGTYLLYDFSGSYTLPRTFTRVNPSSPTVSLVTNGSQILSVTASGGSGTWSATSCSDLTTTCYYAYRIWPSSDTMSFSVSMSGIGSEASAPYFCECGLNKSGTAVHTNGGTTVDGYILAGGTAGQANFLGPNITPVCGDTYISRVAATISIGGISCSNIFHGGTRTVSATVAGCGAGDNPLVVDRDPFSAISISSWDSIANGAFGSPCDLAGVSANMAES